MSGDILSKDDEAQLNICQNLYFKLCDEGPLQNLDSLRGIMQQVVFSEQVKTQAKVVLMTEYCDQYMKSMDSDNSSIGVDNYASEALSLASHKTSEIDKWQSGLKLNTLQSIPSVRKFLIKHGIKSNAEDDTFLKELRVNLAAVKEPNLNLSNFISKIVPQYDETVKATDQAKRSNIVACQSNGSSNYDKVRHSSKPSKSTNSWSKLYAPPQKRDQNAVQSRQGMSNVAGTKRKLEEENLEDTQKASAFIFRTAAEQLSLEIKKTGKVPNSCLGSKKNLGTRRGGIGGQFVLPVRNTADENVDEKIDNQPKNMDPKLIEIVENEMMDSGPPVTWDDIAGLEFVKKTIKEIVVYPMLRPDIFSGLRGPPKGLLLFGPPGTGKTLIGKCIASNAKATFFNISASTLGSKWIGDGEKLVRALFAVARCHQPAVIFIDEIDSLLSRRNDTEHESSRKMKTEFFVQMDGAATNANDRLLLVGATNRPQELDDAARRRLVKRLYVPLPELHARKQIIANLLHDQRHELSDEHVEQIGIKTEGYSGADMTNLCKEAALGPVRCISFDEIEQISMENVRPITIDDFEEALHQIKASVSENDFKMYTEWNQKFGSTRGHDL